MQDRQQLIHTCVEAAVATGFDPGEPTIRINEVTGAYAVAFLCRRGHVTLHVRPDQGFVVLDVLSMSEHADEKTLVRTIREYLKPGKIKVTYVTRGDFGTKNDMKPRSSKDGRTTQRLQSMGRTFRRIMLKPRSM